MMTSKLIFSEWDKILTDPMTTGATSDRLVHDAKIPEFDSENH